MARNVQEPVEQDEPGERGKAYTHPAFAQIAAGRVEGGRVLYGSDFQHQRYIRIRIASSVLHRNLANDWYYASNRPYIEVDLSEAQWATFVSSMNVGQGVPCTLASKDGQDIPGIPDPVNRAEQFGGEARERMQRAARSLDSLGAMLADSGLSKAKAKPLLDALASARQDLASNLQFVAEQFDEHMERTVEAAKVEVNAYAMHVVTRAGIQALADATGAAPLTLEYAEKDRP